MFKKLKVILYTGKNSIENFFLLFQKVMRCRFKTVLKILTLILFQLFNLSIKLTSYKTYNNEYFRMKSMVNFDVDVLTQVSDNQDINNVINSLVLVLK